MELNPGKYDGSTFRVAEAAECRRICAFDISKMQDGAKARLSESNALTLPMHVLSNH
jgi:hypothetical protein